MARPVRTLALALVATLAAAGSAQAVIIDTPQFTFSPFTRAQTGAGNAVTATLTWLPPTFSPPTAGDKQEVTVTDLDAGGSTTYAAGAATASFPLLLSDGHRYRIRVAACSTTTCVPGSVNTAESEGTTRIDATPPAGTVQINQGAAATNDRAVTLGLTASDPLIGGAPGTSSGVTQSATDVDGDGTFPCILFGTAQDATGCAVPLAPTVPATLPPGDGVKTVGVMFGDGARANTSPCPPGILCATLLGSFILGNASPPATDTILLDTVKPVAQVSPSSASVERGASLSFDSAGSTDTSPTATPSGVVPTASSWNFNDGTPAATGARVTHTFTTSGTFVGELRAKDRAGNYSDPRTFSVTVTPKPGEVTAGGGSTAGVSGTAAFSISRLTVKARYAQSRLKASISVRGTSTRSGGLRVEIRRTARSRVLRALSTTVAVAGFTKTLTLPTTLLPGSYRVAFIGPGGTLTTTLTLTAPKEGVISAGRVTLAGARASARFTFAAPPAPPLRSRLSVRWTQGARALGVVSVGSGRVVRAPLPAGARLGTGGLRAVLRAGSTVVGSASVRVR